MLIELSSFKQQSSIASVCVYQHGVNYSAGPIPPPAPGFELTTLGSFGSTDRTRQSQTDHLNCLKAWRVILLTVT